MHSVATTETTADNAPETLPFSLPLELTVNDPEVISELWAKQEGRERDEYALGALRLGVLALRQARGQIDANTLKREGEHLLGSVQLALSEHRTNLDRTLVGTLAEYFHPESGRFTERVQRLLKKDGELETLLSRKVTAADSEMCRALSGLVGKDSPLVRLLSPDESNEFLKALHAAVSKELEGQRTQVLREFSLDNKEGALSRLVGELTDKNGQLRKDLQEKIDALVKQFSFDDEQSALSRMSKTVATTNEAISKHLTLDDKDSALSRLRRELMEVLGKHGEADRKFQEEVRLTLEKMQTRREEAAASTRHGGDFEAVVFEVVQSESQRLKDIATAVGNSTGLIKNCKKGDAVVELGPESAAPSAKIVVEAKEDASYDLKTALAEIETARQNREAESGLFVFSKKTAPAGLEPLARYGTDVVVVWDADDLATDTHLRLGLSVARALCTRKAMERTSLDVDFTAIDAALLEIAKQVKELDDDPHLDGDDQEQRAEDPRTTADFDGEVGQTGRYPDGTGCGLEGGDGEGVRGLSQWCVFNRSCGNCFFTIIIRTE